MKALKKIYIALIMLFLYAPMLVMVVFSFNASNSTSVMSGFSLKWYVEMFRNATALTALRNTLVLAVTSALISIIIGTAAAVGINAMKKRWLRSAVMTVTNVPMMNPEIVTGVSMMLLFVFAGKIVSSSSVLVQGLEEDGLKYMQEAGQATGLATVCEVVSQEAIEAAVKYVDMIQIGARNMQNFDLLRELGKLRKPILLKRGLASTLKELLMSAEYIMAGGNEQVILCERGIRTFDDYTRNTLDLAAVPMLKELTHLPIIVDPSHATGIARLVEPMALAATACGADGLIIEVHNDPMHALCDGAQSLRPEVYDDVAKKVRSIREVIAK